MERASGFFSAFNTENATYALKIKKLSQDKKFSRQIAPNINFQT